MFSSVDIAKIADIIMFVVDVRSGETAGLIDEVGRLWSLLEWKLFGNLLFNLGWIEHIICAEGSGLPGGAVLRVGSGRLSLQDQSQLEEGRSAVH